MQEAIKNGGRQDGVRKDRTPVAIRFVGRENDAAFQVAAQCGFCTPGMLLSSISLLEKNPKPSREEIVEGISGNLCRCGAYLEVIEAIEAVANGEGKE